MLRFWEQSFVATLLEWGLKDNYEEHLHLHINSILFRFQSPIFSKLLVHHLTNHVGWCFTRSFHREFPTFHHRKNSPGLGALAQSTKPQPLSGGLMGEDLLWWISLWSTRPWNIGGSEVGSVLIKEILIDVDLKWVYGAIWKDWRFWSFLLAVAHQEKFPSNVQVGEILVFCQCKLERSQCPSSFHVVVTTTCSTVSRMGEAFHGAVPCRKCSNRVERYGTHW